MTQQTYLRNTSFMFTFTLLVVGDIRQRTVKALAKRPECSSPNKRGRGGGGSGQKRLHEGLPCCVRRRKENTYFDP